MTMIAAKHSPEDIVQRGKSIYNQTIRARVEPQHNGKYLIINIDTGEYEMDADDIEASRRARIRFPDGQLFAMRVGRPAAYRLGGPFRTQTP